MAPADFNPGLLADELSDRGITLDQLAETALLLAQRNPDELDQLTEKMGPFGPMVKSALMAGVF